MANQNLFDLLEGKSAGVDENLALITGDWHLGEHDPAAVCVVLQAIVALRPGTIILNGDILDCTELHKNQLGKRAVQQTHRSSLTVEEEIDQAHYLVKLVRKLAPSADIIFTEGNHELRWGRVMIKDAPHLFGITPTLPALLGLKELNIKWIPHGRVFNYRGWNIFHGTRCNIHAGRCSMMEMAASCLQGHSHRLKMYSMTTMDGRTLYGLEGGHLHLDQASYTPRETPDWQKGFTLLTTSQSVAYPTLVPVVENSAILPGKIISVDPKGVHKFWAKVGGSNESATHRSCGSTLSTNKQQPGPGRKEEPAEEEAAGGNLGGDQERLKICPDCHSALPLSSYYAHPLGRDGVRTPCKSCYAIRRKTYAKHPRS